MDGRVRVLAVQAGVEQGRAREDFVTGSASSLFTASIDCDSVQLCCAVRRSSVLRAAATSLLKSSVNCRSSGLKPLVRGLSTLSVPTTSSAYLSGMVSELFAPFAPSR